MGFFIRSESRTFTCWWRASHFLYKGATLTRMPTSIWPALPTSASSHQDTGCSYIYIYIYRIKPFKGTNPIFVYIFIYIYIYVYIICYILDPGMGFLFEVRAAPSLASEGHCIGVFGERHCIGGGWPIAHPDPLPFPPPPSPISNPPPKLPPPLLVPLLGLRPRHPRGVGQRHIT